MPQLSYQFHDYIGCLFIQIGIYCTFSVIIHNLDEIHKIPLRVNLFSRNNYFVQIFFFRR